MAPHSSTLAWKIAWTQEPGGLQSMGSLRVGHDWATSLSLFTFMHWRRKWQPTPVLLPWESQGQGSLVGCHVCSVTQSWAVGKPPSRNWALSLTLISPTSNLPPVDSRLSSLTDFLDHNHFSEQSTSFSFMIAKVQLPSASNVLNTLQPKY